MLFRDFQEMKTNGKKKGRTIKAKNKEEDDILPFHQWNPENETVPRITTQ